MLRIPLKPMVHRTPTVANGGVVRYCKRQRLTLVGSVSSLIRLLSIMVLALAGSAAPGYAQDRSDALRFDAPGEGATNVRLRFAWGGATPANYDGAIEIDSGNIRCLKRLTVDDYEPGFVVSQDPKHIPIRDAGTRFGGVDVELQGEPETRIRVRIQVRTNNSSTVHKREFDWSLAEIRDQSAVVALDDVGTRFSVDRLPGDRIRVVTDRSHLVYDVDEPLGLKFSVHESTLRNTNATLDISLIRNADGSTIKHVSKTITTNESGSSTPIDIGIPNVPRDEGVYELHLSLTPKRMIPGLLTRTAALKRTVQFVVFSDVEDRAAESGTYRDDVVHDDEWIRVGNVSLDNIWKTTARQEMLRILEPNKANRSPIKTRPLQWLTELGGTTASNRTVLMSQASPDNEMEGYLASGDKCGFEIGPLATERLHRIRLNVGFPESKIQIRIGNASAETDAKTSMNDVLVQTIDSDSKWFGWFNGEKTHSVDMLFWATGLKHSVSIQNLHPTNELMVRSVAVDMWNPATRVGEYDRRKFAGGNLSSVLELKRTNLSRWFGVPMGHSASNEGSSSEPRYDDWASFLKASRRLAEYCLVNGYDTVRLPVVNSGAGLYPSAQLWSSPRYDTGGFALDGRDPMQKDVVELMYRVLGRYGVRFEPLLDVSSPIYGIEAIRQTSGDGDLMQQSTNSTNGNDYVSNRYNPLSDRFQFEFAKLVGEFKSRYGRKVNYAGVGCVIDEQSHLRMIDSIESLNELILEKFAAESVASLPRDRGERQRFISTHATGMFHDWAHEGVTRWLNKEVDRIVHWPKSDSLVPNDIGTDIERELREWKLDGPRSVCSTYEFPTLDASGAGIHFRSLVCKLDSGAMRRFPVNRGQGAGEVDFWVPDLRASDRFDSSSYAWKNGKQFILANENPFEEWITIEWDALPNVTQVASSSDRGKRSIERDELIKVIPGEKSWIVNLPPKSTIAFRVNSLTAMPIVARVEGSNTAKNLDTAMQLWESGINTLSSPCAIHAKLLNGGFEDRNEQTKPGSLTGWTTSIAPGGDVRVDTEGAIEGRQSLLVESRSNEYGGWIQSDPFPLTASQRLLLTVKTLAEPVPESVVLSLWIYNRSSKAFEVVSRHEIADRYRNSQAAVRTWDKVTVDFSNEIGMLNQNDPVNVYRIQMDIRTSGKVWFDAVELFDSYLYEEVRRDLRSQLFVARRALQAGDFGPAIALSDSSWNYVAEWSDRLRQDPESFLSRPLPSDSNHEAARSAPSKTLEPSSPLKRKKGFWWFSRPNTQR